MKPNPMQPSMFDLGAPSAVSPAATAAAEEEKRQAKERLEAERRRVYEETGVIASDRWGNKVWRGVSSGAVYVTLATECGRAREIGRLDNRGDCFYTPRDRSQHLLRALNAYGFCWHLIERAEMVGFTRVVLTDQYGTYDIPVEVVREYGIPKNFKKSEEGGDFELQLFVPLEIINQYKTGKEKLI